MKEEKTVPPAAGLRPEEQLQVIGACALRWQRLREEASAAKDVRAGIRDFYGPCKRELEGRPPCWTEPRTPDGEPWCGSCDATEPATFAYWKAVRRAAAALTSMRREVKKYEAAKAAEAVAV